MKRLKAKIIEHKKIAQGLYKMRLASAYLAKNSRPGQFIEVKCSDGEEVLLRRPLGVHRISNGGIEVLYEIVGKGTELLSRKNPGGMLDIIGPLGNGFALSAKRYPLNAILIAGGMGVAPLVALAENLARRKKQDSHVLIGAKTKNHILCESDFKNMGCRVEVATEDGSKGKKCVVTDLLKKLLETIRDPMNTTIYACGPNPMLKAVGRIADSRGVPCQVSMEERMACGVGVCLGCPVKVRTASMQYEYKMVCKDGPVFEAKEIAW